MQEVIRLPSLFADQPYYHWDSKFSDSMFHASTIPTGPISLSLSRHCRKDPMSRFYMLQRIVMHFSQRQQWFPALRIVSKISNQSSCFNGQTIRYDEDESDLPDQKMPGWWVWNGTIRLVVLAEWGWWIGIFVSWRIRGLIDKHSKRHEGETQPWSNCFWRSVNRHFSTQESNLLYTRKKSLAERHNQWMPLLVRSSVISSPLSRGWILQWC